MDEKRIKQVQKNVKGIKTAFTWQKLREMDLIFENNALEIA